MAKKKVDYGQVKELCRQGLNVNQTALKLGVARSDVMKAIREHFSRSPLQLKRNQSDRTKVLEQKGGEP
jgi:hypothetical protein